MSAIDIEEEVLVSFTPAQLLVVNRLFDVVDETILRAHYFTKADIENIYGALGQIREGLDEVALLHEVEDE